MPAMGSSLWKSIKSFNMYHLTPIKILIGKNSIGDILITAIWNAIIYVIKSFLQNTTGL